MARVNRQLGAMLVGAGHGVDVREVELRIDALGVHVEGKSHEVHVAGALAVAEETALDAVGAGHQAEFGSRHRRTAVVVRMEADEHAVAAGEIAVHPLDLVGVDVRRGHFHRGREIEDDLAFGRGAPGFGHGITHLKGKIELGGGKGFRAVLEHELGFRLGFGKRLDELDGIHRHLHHLRLAHAEHVLAEGFGGGVIDVNDGALDTLERLEGAANEVFARLGEHLDGDVIGDVIAFDQATYKIELGLRGGRKGHFDFLEADGAKCLEHPHFLLAVHRFEERLVAVAKIGAHPDRRGVDDTAGPLAIGELNLRKGVVFGDGLLRHDKAPKDFFNAAILRKSAWQTLAFHGQSPTIISIKFFQIQKMSNLIAMDRYDRQILAILQQEGRISNQDLADRIGLSPSPCLRRVRTLEEAGLIIGYRAFLDARKLGLTLMALIGISMDLHTPERFAQLEASIMEIPEVLECLLITGQQSDYQLKVVVRDMDAYQDLLLNKITRIQGVTGVHTSFVLRRVVDRTALPVTG